MIGEGSRASEQIEVEHSADGTTVTGTSRDDRDVIDLLKSQGFRWSRRIEAWFLPRPWREPVRAQRVQVLERELGDRVAVTRPDAPRRSAAEREHDRRERAAARVERMQDRAERARGREAAAESAGRQISDAIPMGQPILMGHHSQRRHERALERRDSHFRREMEEHRRAEAASAAAERAERTATGVESIVTTGNRIERLEAEARRLERAAANSVAVPEYRERMSRLLEDVRDELQHSRAKLAARGGVAYSAENVKGGDFVKVRGLWYPVIRASAKSATIPNPHLASSNGNGYTDRAPWREVQDHLARADATRERVRGLAAVTSGGFPTLRARLVEEAERLG